MLHANAVENFQSFAQVKSNATSAAKMQVKQLFFSPKDVAIIFDMSVRQVYYHAHNGSEGFPRPKLIGQKRKFMRFCIEETQKCATDWRWK